LPNTRILTIAMGQMLVIPGHLDDNLARAHSMIQQAGARNADVVVLPETLDLGWTYPNAPSLAQPIPGPITDLLASWAQELASLLWQVSPRKRVSRPTTLPSFCLLPASSWPCTARSTSYPLCSRHLLHRHERGGNRPAPTWSCWSRCLC